MDVRKLIFHLVLVTMILACNAVVSAGESEGIWLEDRISGVRVWDPDRDSEKVISWSGGSTEGKASGKGILVVFKAGELTGRYTGTMVEGRVEGPGEEISDGPSR